MAAHIVQTKVQTAIGTIDIDGTICRKRAFDVSNGLIYCRTLAWNYDATGVEP